MTPEEQAQRLRVAVRSHPIAWMEMFACIITKAGQYITGKLAPMRSKLQGRGSAVLDLVPNEMQRRFVEIYRYCRKHGIPCRFIVLKPRQKGASTGSVALLYTHLRNYLAKGCIIGDEFEKSVKNLVDMFGRYADNDGFDWRNTYTGNDRGGKFSHGAELVVETANDPRAGASGTLQALLATEVAHWKKRGEASADKVLLAILSCLAKLPNTLGIIESTPNGIGGAYYDMWQGAVDWQDFQRGVRGNGYVRVFFPWFAFEDSQLKLSPAEAAELMEERQLYPDRFTDEPELRDKHGCTEEQLAWRWRTLKEDCGNDPAKFRQEYPSDPKSCFLGSGRQRFNAEGVKAWEELSRKYPPRVGVLSTPKVGHSMVVARPAFAQTTQNEAYLHLWEEPAPGRSYLLVVDPMRGAEQVQGAKREPDCHAVGVLRQGYRDAKTGVYYRPRLVARIAPPCRVDIDILADMIVDLSRYYGNCMVVVEANAHGVAVLQELKRHGDIPLYAQKMINMRENKVTERLGFQNIDHRSGGELAGLRTRIIEKLAAAIREYNNPGAGLDVCCPHCVEECTTFVLDETGRAAAMNGYHDDDVLMLAIGLECLGEATMYPESVVLRAMPADLARQLQVDSGWQVGGGQYS